MTKVSVNVPIYNRELYLRKCLDSLTKQTLKEIEFILVDDGSTDSSGLICDEYASTDPRFKVIHKPNGGVASARQVALEASIGEYVIICDSDDWVEPTMYEILYRKAIESKADIVECGYTRNYENGKIINCLPPYPKSNDNITISNFIRKSPPSSWNKLVRRSLFTDNSISYQKDVNMGEDKLILYKLLLNNPRIVALHNAFYHYRKESNNSSYTSQIKPEYIQQMKTTYDWFKTNYSMAEYEDVRHCNALNILTASFRSPDTPSSQTFTLEFIKSELKWKNILRNPLSPKNIFAGLAKLTSFKFTKRLYSYIYPYISK